MFNNVRREKGERHSHIFVAIQWGLKIHVLDVGTGKASPWCTDGAVPEELGRHQVGGACGELKGVIDEIPADGDADMVGILFWGQ